MMFLSSRVAGRLAVAERRALCSFATPGLLAAVNAKGSTTIDLRTKEEIDVLPGPTGSLQWDFRNDPTLPATGLPSDKNAPVILF